MHGRVLTAALGVALLSSYGCTSVYERYHLQATDEIVVGGQDLPEVLRDVQAPIPEFKRFSVRNFYRITIRAHTPSRSPRPAASATASIATSADG